MIVNNDECLQSGSHVARVYNWFGGNPAFWWNNQSWALLTCFGGVGESNTFLQSNMYSQHKISLKYLPKISRKCFTEKLKQVVSL